LHQKKFFARGCVFIFSGVQLNGFQQLSRRAGTIICMELRHGCSFVTQFGTRFVIISVVKLHLLSSIVAESTCDIPTKCVYDVFESQAISYRALPHDTHKLSARWSPHWLDVHTVGFSEGNQSRGELLSSASITLLTFPWKVPFFASLWSLLHWVTFFTQKNGRVQ
jgi:hypothetical protein